jgi:N-hydroxyarylamine O-acetyltransferase
MNREPEEIDGYCARIGYSGSREPTLAVLRAIVAGHTSAIPFENLDVLAKRPIRLDLPSLREKLVRHRRGGYCYEHNLLLLDVLLAFGFRAGGPVPRCCYERIDDRRRIGRARAWSGCSPGSRWVLGTPA